MKVERVERRVERDLEVERSLEAESGELRVERTEGKSALEEAGGNYLMAGMILFDRLPLPRPLRRVLQAILVLVAAFTALCALLWPLLMPYLG